MPPPSSLVSRLKVQVKLAISRLRMVQQKDSALAKQQRRALAQLLEQGKLESARIRVENIIRSDITTELHEILELYCELLLARSQLLDVSATTGLVGSSGGGPTEPDPALAEAVRSIVYAAPHTEIKELHLARGFLVEKFGKDFMLKTMEGEGVAERVLKKLKVETPSPELVEAYLREIARAYGVPFGQEDEEDEDVPDEDDGEDDGGDGGGQKATQTAGKQQLNPPLEAEPGTPTDASAPEADSKAARKADEVDELSRATPPRAFGPKSPVRIAPPSPRTENVAPKVKLPGGGTGKAAAASTSAAASKPKSAATSKDTSGNGPGGKIPDVDELAKRFAALKR